MGDASLNEPLVPLLLQHLLRPGWTIALDRRGVWRATGQVTVSASDADGLLDVIRVADPDTVERAVRILSER